MSASNLSRTLELSLPAAIAVDSPTPGRLQNEVLSLFDEHEPRLSRYVHSFGLDAPAAEDVVQEVFLALFRHLQKGRPRTNLKAWLFQVAHNLALKQRRKLSRLRETELDDALIGGMIDSAATPEQRIVHHQRCERLRAVFRALPEADRRCLRLRAEGLRYRDIARVLGISLGSVAKSLARGMTRLMNADRR
jgi:RNA polymerase sigma-70 factor, ECF subfamily